MGVESLISQMAELEKEGISVTIGAGAAFLVEGKSVFLRWASPDHWTTGKPSGWISEHAKFADYADLQTAFDDTLEKLRARIAAFLAGSGI